MDATCGENDPNGPFYDPTHGVYHQFYQDHLAEPQQGHGAGPVWGHAVSRDFIHWARLPVAIWNDQRYDEVAIYTGSTTLVDGKPVIVYPGLCVQGIQPNCTTGTLLAVAMPADPSDPLYTKWAKPDYNPIANNTQRDPSTAWQEPQTGEWRLTTYNTQLYSTLDFVHWIDAGTTPGFPVGECPSFYPLPAASPAVARRDAAMHRSIGSSSSGNGDFEASEAGPDIRVHKCSHGGKDWTRIGAYNPGPVGSAGTFTASQGYPFAAHLLDAGHMYASKDFYDPVHRRRINWGWATVPPASTQTLPREVTWDSGVGQLLTNTVAEQQALRGAELASASQLAIQPNATVWLGDWPGSVGNQSEVLVTFARPTSPTTFGVDVMVGPGASNGTNSSVRVYVDYTLAAVHQREEHLRAQQVWRSKLEALTGIERERTAHDAVASLKAHDAASKLGVAVGVGTPSPRPELSKYMLHTDLPGADFNVTNVNYKNASLCEAVCMANPECVAWTFVVRPPLYASCCQKHGGFGYNPANEACVSGVRTPGPAPPPANAMEDTLVLLGSDDSITLHAYVDNTFLEAYWQGGRVAMTANIDVTPAAAAMAGMSLFNVASGNAGTVISVEKVTAWHVNSIWVSPDDVLATPRS